MHEIDRRVRFQQPPPGALPRVGLARNEQHAQAVAHTVDGEDLLVVDRRGLARFSGGIEQHHRGTLARHRQSEALNMAEWHRPIEDRIAVPPDSDAGFGHLRARTEILDNVAQRHGAADDAVAWSIDKPQAAIGLLTLRREEQVEGCGERRLRRG